MGMKLRGSKYGARFLKMDVGQTVTGQYLRSKDEKDKEGRKQRLHYFQDDVSGEEFILTGSALDRHFNNGEKHTFEFDGEKITNETVKPEAFVKVIRGKDKKLQGGKTLKTFSVYE